MAAEDEIVIGEFIAFIRIGFMFTIFAVLFQKTLQFRREVDIAVAGACLWLLDDDFFACELDDIAADMNGTLTVVDIAPFQTAAFAAPNLGRTIYIGSYRFGAEQWRVCYAAYAVVTVAMFAASFFVKKK